MLQFPTPYSMLKYHISALGGFARNPDGNLIYNLGIFVIGIALLPHIKYLLKNLVQLKFFLPQLGRVLGGLGGLGCLGFSGLGVFPEDRGIPHMICALASFIGFIALAIGIYLYSIRSAAARFSAPSLAIFRIVTGFVIMATVAVIIMPNADILALRWGLPAAVFEFSPYEWMAMISIITWMVGFTGVIVSFSHQERHPRQRSTLTSTGARSHQIVAAPEAVRKTL